MIEAGVESTSTWLPLREAIGPISRHLGYAAEHTRLRIVRFVRTRRIRMRGRNAEGLLVDATGHGEIDWSDESIELCLDDLIETGQLPTPGRPEGPAEQARQRADRAVAYIITGFSVEWGDWTSEMIRETEQGEIELGEAIGDGLPAQGQKSLQEPIEPIPRNDFRPEMVAMKALPVNPLRLPKVTVRVDGTVGVSPRHRLRDYMGPPWCSIEVDWAGLRQAHPRPTEPEPAPPSSKVEPEPSPESELAKAESTRWQLDPTIEAIKSIYSPDGIRPTGMSIAALTKRINKLPEFKDSVVSEDTVRRADIEIKAALKK